MRLQVKALVCLVVAGASASLYSTSGYPNQQWIHFFVYLAAILLSSGMKVALPKTEGTMSVNFPFILLGILQLSPLQAVCLAVASVIAQCRIRVIKPFTLIQILFNVANVTTATVLAWHTYFGCLKFLNGESAPALAVAATVYFVANSVPVTLIITSESRISPMSQWRQEFLWYLPFYLVGAMLAAAAHFVGLLFGWMTSLLLIPMVYTVYRAYCAQMAIVRDRERHLVETEALHLRTIEGLAMAVEAKDQNTHRHLMRVRVYVSELGKSMGLDRPLMQALTTAAFLHDIGKLAVPEHIINKPGKLTPEEFEKMKIHPVVGADILERVHFPYPVVPIVRSHHEAWDGSGYPDGLKGEEIPIGARILTAVDCFDALASERPYRRAMPLDEAMAFVKNKAGIQFDPAVVKLLAERYLELEELARQQIEEVEPLKTDLFIERGAAPGAGFEPERAATQPEGSDANAAPDPKKIHADALNLIAAASQEAKEVFELSQTLGSSLGSRGICAMLSRRLKPFIPFDCLAVYLKREESVELQFVDGRDAQAFSSRPIPMGEGLSGWVAHSERPIVNGNPTVEPSYLPESKLFSQDSSALSAPLFDLSGAVFGVLTVYSSRNAAFSKIHLRVLQAMEPKFSQALKNALRFQPAETDTEIDALTRLPNLRAFFQRVDTEVQKARGTKRRFGVGVCDLNAFKSVNDRHGHMAGDALLCAIAQELRDRLNDAGVVARAGGDEFAFLFPVTAVSFPDDFEEMVRTAVRKACGKINLDADLSCSVGIACYPANGESAEDLLGRADREMHRRKRDEGYERRTTETHADLEDSLTV